MKTFRVCLLFAFALLTLLRALPVQAQLTAGVPETVSERRISRTNISLLAAMVRDSGV